MPGGVGGVEPRGSPLSRSVPRRGSNALCFMNKKNVMTPLNRSGDLPDQRMSNLNVFKNARRGSMSNHFSPRDMSTYKQWLAKIAIVYCATRRCHHSRNFLGPLP